MPPDFRPLSFPPPRIVKRRREKSRWVPPDPAIIQNRAKIARAMQLQILPITRSLRAMTATERRAVFLKLSHDGVITQQTLSGTGLRLISPPALDYSLVIPKEADLHKLEEKVREFGAEPLKEDRAPVAYDLLSKISTIAPGLPTDRLSEEIQKDYALYKAKEFFVYEIEIVSLEAGPKKRRQDLSKTVDDIKRFLGNGVSGIVYEADYAEGTARVCLSSTGAAFKNLVESPEWQRRIIFFDARPQFETFHQTLRDFRFAELAPVVAPPKDAPIVCIIDSGVSAGNPFLAPVVVKKLLKSYVPTRLDDPSDELGHGSGVASLAAYYALNLSAGAENTAHVRIASARIMAADGQLDDYQSATDQEHYEHQARLLSSVLRQIVKDFKPHGIRIFVLAFNIVNRLWNDETRKSVPRTSWVARTIDQLSREQDVVFVTITGNMHGNEISDLMRTQSYPGYFSSEQARLQDPGHAALSVTVGSVAHSTIVTPPAGVPIALIDQPSPFSRTGPGMSKCMKPDFVERGGNSILIAESGAVTPNPGTDVVMASHRLTPAVAHDRGTSFAAPRVAHQLARIQKYLEDSGLVPSSVLLKALLANSARFDDGLRRWLEGELSNQHWSNVVGLGSPDGMRAISADDYSAILYFDGKIPSDTVALFSVPVPKELAAGRAGTKRLTVTMAYAPPIQRWGLEEYLGVRAKFRVFRGDLDPEAIVATMGLEDDEKNVVKEGEKDLRGALLGINLRSRGTLQQDCFEWPSHDPLWSAHPYTIAISLSKPKWGKSTDDVPVALVVRVEDTTKSVVGLNAAIARAVVPVRVRA